jgi:hypothetical protein
MVGRVRRECKSYLEMFYLFADVRQWGTIVKINNLMTERVLFEDPFDVDNEGAPTADNQIFSAQVSPLFKIFVRAFH